jgi:DNA invertase Pin-like site-specific DNA recombinase
MFYGYARVSTFDQDLTLQRAALKAAGGEVIRAGTAPAATAAQNCRCCSSSCARATRWWSLASTGLARSVKDLQDIMHELKARGSSRVKHPLL